MTISLIIKTGPDSGKVIVIGESVQEIGRSYTSDIVIPEPSLSRRHARIVPQEDGVLIEDLGSANGTYINGKPVKGAALLNPGDTLRLGDIVIIDVQHEEPLLDDHATIRSPLAGLGRSKPESGTVALGLVIQQGPNVGQVFGLNQEVTYIGRGADSDIILNDASLSRRHAKITVLGEGIVVEDLGSANGTYVNATRIVGPTLMHAGDALQLGNQTLLKLQSGALSAPVPVRLPVSLPSAEPTIMQPALAPTPVPASGGTSPWLWMAGAGAIVIVVGLLVIGGFYYLFNVQSPTDTSDETAAAQDLPTPVLEVATEIPLPTKVQPDQAAPTFTATPTQPPPTATPVLPSPTAELSSGSDTLTLNATPTAELPAATATPTASPTATPVPPAKPTPVPPTQSPVSAELAVPKVLDYTGLSFLWQWQGVEALSENVDWYFDIKIFNGAFSQYPYDVLVAEPEDVSFDNGMWSFVGGTNFQCGSHWAIQIAKRNPDGSYAGPLSPESNRLPIGPSCGGGGSDSNSGSGSSGGSGSGGGGGSDPCDGCD